ncbi:hypothetical protein X566_21690 [Afipia sp. P52-10]|jgi:hypothetical protein|nr:hypothetical protein X566_21690 [Afipia sp. P52-10]
MAQYETDRMSGRMMMIVAIAAFIGLTVLYVLIPNGSRFAANDAPQVTMNQPVPATPSPSGTGTVGQSK